MDLVQVGKVRRGFKRAGGRFHTSRCPSTVPHLVDGVILDTNNV